MANSNLRTLLGESTADVSQPADLERMFTRSVTTATAVLNDKSPVLACAILNLEVTEKDGERTPAVSLCYTQKSPGREEGTDVIATFVALSLMRDTLEAELEERRPEFVAAAALASADLSNPQ